MGHFTADNIRCEIRKVEECALTPRNLELFVLLHKALKCLEHDACELTEQEAKEWIRCMDPPARWTVDQASATMRQRGYHHDAYTFCAVMNALASDYGKTLAKHNADKPEVWADLAHDFIEDADAMPDKVGQYYHNITKH